MISRRPTALALDAYVAFWFAWAIFQPDTEIREASGGSGDRVPAAR